MANILLPLKKEKKRQQDWSNYIHNKVFQIKCNIGEWKPGFRKFRKKQVTISQLHIHHTRLTHNSLLKQDNQPEWKPGFKKFRKKQVTISQLHIYRTRLTHDSLLKQDN